MSALICHASLGVRDLDRATRFYDAALAPLDVVAVWRTERGVGYGFAGKDDQLAIFPFDEARAAGRGTHLALRATTTAAVDAFYRAAIAHGGTDEGEPGLRPKYGPGYYAAFVRDPDGNKLEAVCHLPK